MHEKIPSIAGYNQSEEDRPLASYAQIMAVFAAQFGVFLLAVKSTRRPLPERVEPADLLLLGTATHKLSRLLAKDAVTSALRAPFTTYEEPAGAGEINESTRGTGRRHAIGELLTCPFCMAQWVAAFFTYGLVFVPRVTRLVAGMLVMVTLSDFLQFAYDAAKKSE